MVLVDTSVWIDHFRYGENDLVELLRENGVFIHPLIVGELACGNLRQRTEILPLLQFLPEAELSSHSEVLQFVEKRELFGRGIGWIDAHLLASCMLSDSSLWTKDKSLLKIAKALKIAYARV